MNSRLRGVAFKFLCYSMALLQIIALCFWLRKSQNDQQRIAFIGSRGFKKGEAITLSRIDFLGSVPAGLADLFFKPVDLPLLKFARALRDIPAGSALMIYDIEPINSTKEEVVHSGVDVPLETQDNAEKLKMPANSGKFEIVGEKK